jgi:AcrR family transcriptional regulator
LPPDDAAIRSWACANSLQYEAENRNGGRSNWPSDRIERGRVDKFSARRIELAEAALETLAELGYARTSLREIAQKSEFTHGVLHYYFSDKVDLICCCVRHYKAKCVTRYDQITSAAQSRDELMNGFLEKLGETVRDELDASPLVRPSLAISV